MEIYESYMKIYENICHLREFVVNSRHLDPGRAWKGGPESQLMTPDCADPVNPVNPVNPVERGMSSKKLKVDGRHSTWGKLARKMRAQWAPRALWAP